MKPYALALAAVLLAGCQTTTSFVATPPIVCDIQARTRCEPHVAPASPAQRDIEPAREHNDSLTADCYARHNAAAVPCLEAIEKNGGVEFVDMSKGNE